MVSDYKSCCADCSLLATDIPIVYLVTIVAFLVIFMMVYFTCRDIILQGLAAEEILGEMSSVIASVAILRRGKRKEFFKIDTI